MKKFIKDLQNAVRGILFVYREEKNFRIELLIFLGVLISFFVLPLSSFERIILLVASAFVILSEIVNTAIEDLCDRVNSEHDPLIGKVKDIMAGFVLVSVFFAILLGIFIYLPHLLNLFK